ncbi:hypothetical protein SMD31_11015 [Dongia rigui]|uniref:Uncharacterized protein n=1 Tax=Dongia rigui TaxID=940149 RepID=A0ABU5DYQ2_9PROT|nr:hypothetical protein [Dongia rigui]
MSKDPVILSDGRYMVARDGDVLSPRLAFLPTTIISSRDIIAVPWAKIGFLQGMPGQSSGIAQPKMPER